MVNNMKLPCQIRLYRKNTISYLTVQTHISEETAKDTEKFEFCVKMYVEKLYIGWQLLDATYETSIT